MAKAISMTPSANWKGNDGSWSVFTIEIGTPPQPISVLPATSQQSIWAIIDREGCVDQPFTRALCTFLRGGVYNHNLSTTYSEFTSRSRAQVDYLPFQPEASLGGNYTVGQEAECLAGTDTVILGYPGGGDVILNTELILQYVATLPYIGVLGLSPIAIGDATPENLQQTVLGELYSRGLISSLFFAYNAGSLYANAPGSLTLGGYDADRGNKDNVLTVPFYSGNGNRNLEVQINGIVVTTPTGNDTITVPASTVAYIDSLVPELWLPVQTCESVANALGLTWDADWSYYFVNDILYDSLLQADPSFTFTLASPAGTSDEIEITLPYGSFDFNLSFPLAGITTGSTKRYFPLRQATEDTQIILGRTFLQDAYLAVDYNRTEFYLSQATFNAYAKDIVTVSGSSRSLSKGDIAGIVVGSVVGALMVLGVLWWFLIRRRSKKRQERASSITTAATLDVSDGYVEPKTAPPTYERRELDAIEPARDKERQEMESPPPPGSPWSPGSPGSKQTHEMEGSHDYMTAGRTLNTSPIELPAEWGRFHTAVLQDPEPVRQPAPEPGAEPAPESRHEPALGREPVSRPGSEAGEVIDDGTVSEPDRDAQDDLQRHTESSLQDRAGPEAGERS